MNLAFTKYSTAAALAAMLIVSSGCNSADATATAAEVVEPGPVDADAPEEFTETESGLKYRIRRASEGDHPTADEAVTCHYKGWLDDETVFDSSYQRGEPATFPLNGVIAGWTEGLQLIGEGGMIELEIPSDLGYGAQGRPGKIPGGATLHFLVELVDIVKPGPVDEDAPEEFTETESGLKYRIRRASEGNTPTERDTVTVHYRGWLDDETEFDSSYGRGEPISFPLNGVIPGWTEGVQLMVVGEKTRFWIPGNLAYDNSPRPGAPKGMLVFDIELLSIK
jgi:peptidylprolyl isomerase